ncbi:MAG: sulfite exporter TauE/SafE family protein [Bacteroidetes bacterium]|nr:sulfite exporter TauE/SafE family protein [Bacteroidota bacterium]
MEAYFLAALVLGFAGSAHCVGMCGPLALALPVQGFSAVRRWVSVGLYHGGRIFMYALAGVVFGLVGRRFYVAGWQQGLSIGLGVFILCWVVVRGAGGRGWLPVGVYAPLQRVMARVWASPSSGRFFLMGMLNGLLPCGMVYMAVAGALTSSGVMAAAVFMVCFGVGTLPMLVGLQVTGRMVGGPVRVRLRKVLPYLTVVMAVLLILRGLGLGIPFVSPVLAGAMGHAIECR